MKPRSVRLLLLEDDPDDAHLLLEDLAVSAAYRFSVEWVRTLQEAHDALEGSTYGVVLTDLNLGGTKGLETLFELRSRHPEVPIVVLSGNDDAPTAILAMRGGAQDFLVKGKVDREAITRSVAYAMERHRLEWALRRQTEEMRAFTYAVTHDLRTPLISVDFLVDEARNLLDGGKVDGEAADLLNTASDRIATMESLIQDIHLVSRIDCAAAESLVRLAPLVDEVLDDHQAEASRRGVEVRIDVAAMPPFRANPNQMRHLVGNLVGNAIKYTRENGGVIWIRARRVGDAQGLPVWRIEVEDNGPGVPVDQRERIFQPFARATDPLGRSIQGSGLGLAIAAKVAHHIGSWIHVRDARDGGALFTFDIPHERFQDGQSAAELASEFTPDASEASGSAE